ncbi:hypothetical protein EON81_17310 [bacterium]|nr:MAG: hypothetical protein EON81_17310 [bacterium]
MLVAVLALSAQGTIDLIPLLNEPIEALEDRLGTPERWEKLTASVPPTGVLSFQKLLAFRAGAPVKGWTWTIGAEWEKTPQLQSLGVEDVRASYTDGSLQSIKIRTVPYPDMERATQAKVCRRFGIPTALPGEDDEYPNPIIVQNQKWSYLPSRQGDEFWIDLRARSSEPYIPEPDGNVSCTIEFSPQGVPEGIRFSGLRPTGSASLGLQAVGFSTKTVAAVPDKFGSRRVPGYPEWTFSWSGSDRTSLYFAHCDQSGRHIDLNGGCGVYIEPASDRP